MIRDREGRFPVTLLDIMSDSSKELRPLAGSDQP